LKSGRGRWCVIAAEQGAAICMPIGTPARRVHARGKSRAHASRSSGVCCSSPAASSINTCAHSTREPGNTLFARRFFLPSLLTIPYHILHDRHISLAGHMDIKSAPVQVLTTTCLLCHSGIETQQTLLAGNPRLIC
jgi:hypothetical protein